MPDIENNQNNKDGVNNGAAGSSGTDQSGNESGTSDGTSTDDSAGSQNSDASGSDNKNTGEETITIKKSEYDKTLSDLDNYRTGLINKKANDRAGSAQGATDQNQNDSGASNTATLDEKKIREIAQEESNSNLHKSNQKTANAQFLKEHPEFLDDAQWQKFLPYLVTRRGGESTDAIMADLEDSLLLYKKDNGQLDTYLTEQKKAAERQAQIEAQAGMGRSSGGIGDQTNGGSGNTVKVDENMANKFNHDPKTVADIDKNVTRTDEGYAIDVTKTNK